MPVRYPHACRPPPTCAKQQRSSVALLPASRFVRLACQCNARILGWNPFTVELLPALALAPSSQQNCSPFAQLGAQQTADGHLFWNHFVVRCRRNFSAIPFVRCRARTVRNTLCFLPLPDPSESDCSSQRFCCSRRRLAK